MLHRAQMSLCREPHTHSNYLYQSFSSDECVNQRRISYIGELAHSIGFDSDVVLLELLFDLVDACGDVLGLRADKEKDKQQASN